MSVVGSDERILVRAQNLVAAADVILGKIGYGTASESLACGVPLVFVRRDHFNDLFRRSLSSSLSSSSSSSSSAKNKVDDVLERFTRLTADEKRDVFRSLLGTGGDASGFDAAEMDKRERKMFETFDSDGDERLTQQEFQNFHRAFLWKRVQEQNAQKVNEEKKNEAEMDRTGNEVVTVSQLRSVAASACGGR